MLLRKPQLEEEDMATAGCACGKSMGLFLSEIYIYCLSPSSSSSESSSFNIQTHHPQSGAIKCDRNKTLLESWWGSEKFFFFNAMKNRNCSPWLGHYPTKRERERKKSRISLPVKMASPNFIVHVVGHFLVCWESWNGPANVMSRETPGPWNRVEIEVRNQAGKVLFGVWHVLSSDCHVTGGAGVGYNNNVGYVQSRSVLMARLVPTKGANFKGMLKTGFTW